MLYERLLIKNFENKTSNYQLMVGAETVEKMHALCAESVFMVTQHRTEDGMVFGDCHNEIGRTAINAHFQKKMTHIMQQSRLPELVTTNYTKAFESAFTHNFTEVEMAQHTNQPLQLRLPAPKTV